MIRKHLIKIRDDIIRKGWQDNKDKIERYEYVEMWEGKLSIPSIYRIIKEMPEIIGKIVPDKKLNNRVIYYKNAERNSKKTQRKK